MKQLITCIFLFIVQFCYSQDMWLNYTNTHGILDVVETDQGFWLGSEGGLCYYNTETGEETYYNRGNSSIPVNRVTNLIYRSDEELWMFSGTRLCMFDGNEFVLAPENINGSLLETPDNKLIVIGVNGMYLQVEGMEFTSIEYPDYAAGIGGAGINQETGAIYVFINNWFAESYLAVYENGEWTVLSSEYIYDSSMAMDNNNKLWLINDSGLQYFEDGNWVVVSEADLGEDIRFAKLYVNTENQIVILNQTNCAKLYVWDGMMLEEINYTNGDCPQYEFFIQPSNRENGLYYASHFYEGFYSFTKDGLNDYKSLAQSPILSNFVRNTLHPSDGSHIIILSREIQQIKSGVWSRISLPDDYTGFIKGGFLDPEENLWIFDNEFLWSYKNEEWIRISPPPEITEDIELMEIGANGDIWIQSELYIAIYKDGFWYAYGANHHEITTSIIRDLKVDPTTGDLWVSTFSGLRQFDGQTWINHNAGQYDRTNAITFGNDVMYAISVDNIRTLKDGIFDSIPFPLEDNISHTSYKMVYSEEDDKLYFAGISYLAVYHNEEWSVYDSQNSGFYNGLTNDLSIDNNNNIWLSGYNRGIGVYNNAGISLSIAEELEEKENQSLIKVYPTILSQDRFFVESEESGVYNIVVADIDSKIIYRGEHQLIKNIPQEIEIPYANNKLLLVTATSATQKITQKILKIGE